MEQALLRNVLLLAVCNALVACGPGSDAPATYPVSGKVTLDGTPLAEGQISFRDAATKVRSYGGPIKNGEYSFESAAGKKNVVITARREVPGKKGEPAAPDEPAPPLIEQYIPEQYNEKTTLTAEVTESGENKFDFELTGEAAAER